MNNNKKNTMSLDRYGCALLALGWATAATAELKLVPYGSAQYIYYSNLFEVSGRDEAVAQNGTDQRDDTALRYSAGAEASATFGQQRLHLQGEASRLAYNRFDQLDHNEHLIDGGLDWKLASVVDGVLNYRQERRLASLSDLDTSELRVQTDRTGRATVNVNLTPSWRLETAAEAYRSELPLTGAPQFQLEERRGTVGVKHAGTGQVSVGARAGYVDGDYSGLPTATGFKERSLALTLDYVISGISTLQAEAGVEEREDDNAAPGDDGTRGFAGSLSYSREISGKTRSFLKVYRRLDSYDAGANTLTDTGAVLGAGWQATSKVLVNAQYQWLQSEFESGAPGNVGREDRLHSVMLDLTYQLMEWLSIRPFAEYRKRQSNLADAAYEAGVAGLELKARFE